MTDGTTKYLAIGAAAVALAVTGYQMFSGTGPMDPNLAMRLVEYKFGPGDGSVDTIAPDGEKAVAPVQALEVVRVAGCPKIGGSYGSVPGRYGQGGRTHATAAFECLFEGKSRSGTVLYFAAHVWRSADPSYRGEIDGHLLSFLGADRARMLMADLDVPTRSLTRDEQMALWDALAGDDIYVPADGSRPSPIEKAMQQNTERLVAFLFCRCCILIDWCQAWNFVILYVER